MSFSVTKRHREMSRFRPAGTFMPFLKCIFFAIILLILFCRPEGGQDYGRENQREVEIRVKYEEPELVDTLRAGAEGQEMNCQPGSTAEYSCYNGVNPGWCSVGTGDFG